MPIAVVPPPPRLIVAAILACAVAVASAASPVSRHRATAAPSAGGPPARGAEGPSGHPGVAPGSSDPALAIYASSVVKIEASILPEGRTVDSLGRTRVGSGVLIDRQTVVTIGYLLMEAETVEIQSASGKSVPATVVGFDHATGLGLLRSLLPIEGRPLELGDSDRVDESQSVLTIGQGEPEATPLMVISRKPFVGGWEYLVEKPIFTFPPVNNWSGSALMTNDGKLIGIGSLIVDDAASGRPGVPGNMFVPVNLLKPILADLKAKGRSTRPARPWLGLTTETVRGNLMVVRVASGSPADQAGIQAGDIVLGVDDDRVADQADFYRRLWRKGPAGTTVSLRLLHEGSMKEVPVRTIDRHDYLLKPSGI